jgi:phage terminase small subunit
MKYDARPTSELTNRQARFVEEYLLDLNAKQAAIRAGYSPNTAEAQASRLLSLVKVQRAVSESIDRRTARVEVDQDWVLSRLALIAERCLQHVPVQDRHGNPVLVETPDGELAAAYTFQANGATRALELLGKHLGLFPSRSEVAGQDGASLMSDWTEDQLIELILIRRAEEAKRVEVRKPALRTPAPARDPVPNARNGQRLLQDARPGNARRTHG